MAGGSYERINYALRPAKSIERKMMLQALRQLGEFAPLESYRYIGFGSTTFVDFSMFHKALGITSMVSIEKDDENDRRFEFNKPFRCVDIAFGHSNFVLPDMDWDSPTIVWLDYDGRLDTSVLDDLSTFASSAVPGSVLIVSVNAHHGAPGEDRVARLKKDLGSHPLPVGIRSNADLGGWKTAAVFHRVITRQIEDTIRQRSSPLSQEDKLMFQQIFYFHYKDGNGAPMMTLGGVLHREGQMDIIERCGFEKEEFYSPSDEPFMIEVPSLTYREIRHLDSQLPCDDPTSIDAPGINTAHLENYARIYRYFPAFVEAEI